MIGIVTCSRVPQLTLYLCLFARCGCVFVWLCGYAQAGNPVRTASEHGPVLCVNDASGEVTYKVDTHPGSSGTAHRRVAVLPHAV